MPMESFKVVNFTLDDSHLQTDGLMFTMKITNETIPNSSFDDVKLSGPGS